MDKSAKKMDGEEEKIEKLANDINPSEDVTPDSLAEATTVPLDNDALGGTSKEEDLNEK